MPIDPPAEALFVLFHSFARLVDLQRLENVKVDPMSIKVGHPWTSKFLSQKQEVFAKGRSPVQDYDSPKSKPSGRNSSD